MSVGLSLYCTARSIASLKTQYRLFIILCRQNILVTSEHGFQTGHNIVVIKHFECLTEKFWNFIFKKDLFSLTLAQRILSYHLI